MIVNIRAWKLCAVQKHRKNLMINLLSPFKIWINSKLYLVISFRTAMSSDFAFYSSSLRVFIILKVGGAGASLASRKLAGAASALKMICCFGISASSDESIHLFTKTI